jgi:ferredoxin
MTDLQTKVSGLLSSGEINIFIGYKEGFDNKAVPCFIQHNGQVDQLLSGDRCKQNLVGYLHKSEIKAFNKIGVQVNVSGLKTILQLLTENQLKELTIVALHQDQSGKTIVFTSIPEIEAYVKEHGSLASPEDITRIEELEKLTPDERWDYWMELMSTCVKCYACRAACPLCYCTQCTAECNQPQWVPVTPSTLGNFEWQSIRVMHLAGRCIGCGECSRVCPVGIPLHLLTTKMNLDIQKNFGDCNAGMSAKSTYAMNSFRVDDKENFIR